MTAIDLRGGYSPINTISNKRIERRPHPYKSISEDKVNGVALSPDKLFRPKNYDIRLLMGDIQPKSSAKHELYQDVDLDDFTAIDQKTYVPRTLFEKTISSIKTSEAFIDSYHWMYLGFLHIYQSNASTTYDAKNWEIQKTCLKKFIEINDYIFDTMLRGVKSTHQITMEGAAVQKLSNDDQIRTAKAIAEFSERCNKSFLSRSQIAIKLFLKIPL